MSALANVPILSKPYEPEETRSREQRSPTRWLDHVHRRCFSRRNGFIALAATMLLFYYFRSTLTSPAIATESSPSQIDPTTPSTSAALSPPPKVHTTNDEPVAAQPLSQPIDWSRFAYTQYATSINYLCNSIMLFAQLHSLGSRPARVLLYPHEYHYTYSVIYETAEDEALAQAINSLLIKAETEYNVTLKPITTLRRDSARENADTTWSESYTKLLAFNQTEYKRVLNLDSDSSVLQPMDELFLVPSAPVAMPRAYWGPSGPTDTRQLSSQVMLIEPSAAEFVRIEAAIATASDNTYDMEIVNNLYHDSCLVLPHRPYDLLTGEFRAGMEQHRKYLGNSDESWNADATMDEAKFVHFSDWPLPKPWLKAPERLWKNAAPGCGKKHVVGRGTLKEKVDEGRDCSDREVWTQVYEDFRKRRKEVCGLDLQVVIDDEEEQ